MSGFIALRATLGLTVWIRGLQGRVPQGQRSWDGRNLNMRILRSAALWSNGTLGFAGQSEVVVLAGQEPTCQGLMPAHERPSAGGDLLLADQEGRSGADAGLGRAWLGRRDQRCRRLLARRLPGLSCPRKASAAGRPSTTGRSGGVSDGLELPRVCALRRTRPATPEYLCTRSCQDNARTCRMPRVCVGQPGWRPVMAAAGGPVRARLSARRSASGSRYRPAMRRTRSAASAAGIPAAGRSARSVGLHGPVRGRGRWNCAPGTAHLELRTRRHPADQGGAPAPAGC